MFYLVATPIGNLSDITFRAIEVLNQVDYILCEDTRHSQKLLQHYEIKKTMRSYHKFNEAKIEEKVIADLKNGLNIALICDGGTPGISDPGHRLIKRCQNEKLPYCSIPGPCSPILALTLSGLDATRFQFVGFLPKKASDLKRELIEVLEFSGTTICFESPKRLLETLTQISHLSSEHLISVARELTKIHEECIKGTPLELLEHFKKLPVKGEIILLIEGRKRREVSSLSYEQQVQQLMDSYNLTKKEAIKLAAELLGISKKEIYSAVHKTSHE